MTVHAFSPSAKRYFWRLRIASLRRRYDRLCDRQAARFARAHGIVPLPSPSRAVPSPSRAVPSPSRAETPANGALPSPRGEQTAELLSARLKTRDLRTWVELCGDAAATVGRCLLEGHRRHRRKEADRLAQEEADAAARAETVVDATFEEPCRLAARR